MPASNPSARASDPPSLELARQVARRVLGAGGRAFLVGGAVRDRLRGLPATDFDLEVFGLEPEVVQSLLSELGRVDGVGKAFGIFKLSRDAATLDVGLPRTESSTGPGHREFAIRADPNLDVATAASRRDFTINAILEDPLSGEIVDPWNGRADLAARILRHVSAAFGEDPLRVLRAVQFAARFQFTIAEETSSLCRSIDLSALPRERIAGEVEKWLVQGVRPSLGLAALYLTGAVRLFPELERHPRSIPVRGTRLDALVPARTAEPSSDARLALMLAGLVGPESTQEDATALFNRLTIDHARSRQAATLHAAWPEAAALGGATSNDDRLLLPRVRRLALQSRIRALAALLTAEFDAQGNRSILDATASSPGIRLLELATRAGVAETAPQPFLLGRDVLAAGVAPGPRVGALLEQVFDAQLNGVVADREQALALLQCLVAS